MTSRAGHNFVGATGGIIAPAVGKNATDSPRKVIVITGASRGIGLTVLKHFALSPYWSANGGLDIVMLAGHAEPLMTEHNNLQILIQQNMLNTRLLPFVADLAGDTNKSCEKIATQVHNVFGPRIDSLILNAGLLEPLRRIQNFTSEDFYKLQQHFHVNVLSQYKIIADLLPALKQSTHPRIVSLSSGAALKPMVGWSAYTVSKAAVNMLIQNVALEEPGVTAVAVSPGPVESSMQQLIRHHGSPEMDADDYEYFSGLHQRGELTKEEDAAYFIAAAAMAIPKQFSGKFLRISDGEAQTLTQTYRQAYQSVAGPNV